MFLFFPNHSLMDQTKLLTFMRKISSFLMASILLLIYYILSYFVPSPPPEISLLKSWIQEWKTLIQIADEILIFGVLALIPSILVLTPPWKQRQSRLSLFASALFLVVLLPLFVLLDLLLGRLVYPVNSYPMTEDTIVFLLSLIVGTNHMISLVLALAIFFYSVSLRKQKGGNLLLGFGIFVSCLQIFASFPWLLSAEFLLFCQLGFPIWFLWVGFIAE